MVQNYSDLEKYNKKYYDENVIPEYKERLLNIDSIDCYMTENNYKKILCIFDKNGYNIENVGEISRRTNHLYESPICFSNKFLISFKANNLLKEIIKNFNYSISLNVIYGNADISTISNEIFNSTDFECNTLVISPDNNYILPGNYYIFDNPDDKINKIHKIIKDITKKRTKIYYVEYDISEPYLVNLLNEGFDIYSDTFETKTCNIEQKCMMCYEYIEKDLKHIKDANCDTHYCFECYHDMISDPDFNDACPVCGNDISSNPFEHYVINVFCNMGKSHTMDIN
jgi:hypothetical protein